MRAAPYTLSKELIPILYYATHLTPHLARSDEGYLICRGVPVARIGPQTYLPVELDLPGEDPITVLRPEDEVFSPACMASFEGKPVTEDHPPDPEGVIPANIRSLQRGHAQNIRRGTGEESCFLLADLIITDPETVRHILDGKREISCGYTYRLSEENGAYVQREIRGNHIAVVDHGRAGPRVAIRDSRPPCIHPNISDCERRKKIMDPKMKINIRKLAAAALRANDLEPEELQSVMSLMQAVAEEVPVTEPEANEPEVIVAAEIPAAPETEEPVQTPAVTGDTDIAAKLDRVIELLTMLVPAVPAADEGPEDPVVEALARQTGEQIAEALGEQFTNVVASETDEQIAEVLAEETAMEAPEDFLPEALREDADPEEFIDPGVESLHDCRAGAHDAAAREQIIRAAVRAIKPIIASLPADQKRAAADAAARALRPAARSATPAVSYASLRPARATADTRDPRALGRRIMAARSANR